MKPLLTALVYVQPFGEFFWVGKGKIYSLSKAFGVYTGLVVKGHSFDVEILLFVFIVLNLTYQRVCVEDILHCHSTLKIVPPIESIVPQVCVFTVCMKLIIYASYHIIKIGDSVDEICLRVPNICLLSPPLVLGGPSFFELYFGVFEVHSYKGKK